EGVVLIFCGALLLTPGFFTDTIGFLGLVPPLRQAAIRALLTRGVVSTMGGAYQRRRPFDGGGDGEYRTIDGEYRREDE
ncbi:MAG: FxsA family protein, partial [Chromatiales bacterium]|nr:FxsA family protein [Chromatiales bacterium]